jgi:[ribosomal protein S5]-alanine N-acetyltransferase
MEQMPFQPDVMDREQYTQVATRPPLAASIATSDWRAGLPVLTGCRVTLRELRLSDVPSLGSLLTTDEVTRFISPPPTTVPRFHGFIRWAHRERAAGRSVCFAVVPDGYDSAVGLFQVRLLEPGFGTAEWGFAIGSPYWGRGLFLEGARLVGEFAIETIGVHRLEARSAVQNGRGNGALRKIGAVQEGILRKSFLRDGAYFDQVLWSIVDEDWRQTKAVWGAAIS